MTPTLTDADREAISRIRKDRTLATFDDSYGAIYLAGLAAGMERAAKEIERRFGVCPESAAIRRLK
jgi:hypothetical protein